MFSKEDSVAISAGNASIVHTLLAERPLAVLLLPPQSNSDHALVVFLGFVQRTFLQIKGLVSDEIGPFNYLSNHTLLTWFSCRMYIIIEKMDSDHVGCGIECPN